MLDTRSKAEIIFEFVNEYAGQEVFDSFFMYNDLGVPMSVMIVNDLVELTAEGIDVLNETWNELCIELNNADPDFDYEDLDQLMDMNVPNEDEQE